MRNIYKLEKEIRRTHRKLANIRQNYLHHTTTEIVKTKPSRIVVETGSKHKSDNFYSWIEIFIDFWQWEEDGYKNNFR
jgi:predicted oxidoreductase (fatty acid repression mutant protein)